MTPRKANSNSEDAKSTLKKESARQINYEDYPDVVKKVVDELAVLFESHQIY